MSMTDSVVAKFSNEKLRPMADLVGQAYHTAKQVLAEWEAIDGVKIVPATDEAIPDGSGSDGRVALTGMDVQAFMATMAGFIAQFEADGNAVLKATLRVGVNTQSRLR